jgi:CRISPR-associated protein Csm5
MNYRLTCLTPLLVGDGARLSPIDYMVWKGLVNVLDQGRIFRLLSRGPRLDNYLKQISRAVKLDFAAWGGFAQNFARRRIPFEYESYTTYWEKLPPEHLHIPTFATGPSGPYIPATALKGALRTALVFKLGGETILKELEAAMSSANRPPRSVGQIAEERAVGSPGHSRLRPLVFGDSKAVSEASFKIHLLRVSVIDRKGAGKPELRWKQSPKGSVDGRNVEDSTPQFAEMACPGTVFEGTWGERRFFSDPAVIRALGWKAPFSAGDFCQAANDYAAAMLSLHRRYASLAGLALLDENIGKLQALLEEARARNAGAG